MNSFILILKTAGVSLIPALLPLAVFVLCWLLLFAVAGDCSQIMLLAAMVILRMFLPLWVYVASFFILFSRFSWGRVWLLTGGALLLYFICGLIGYFFFLHSDKSGWV